MGKEGTGINKEKKVKEVIKFMHSITPSQSR